MKQIMKRAWELAKEGVAKFGGKVREYFASSLTIAWEDIKGMTEKAFDATDISLAGYKGKTAIVGVPTSLNLHVIDGLNNALNPVQTIVRKENGVEYNIYAIRTDGRYGEFFTAGDGFWRTFKADIKNSAIYYNGAKEQGGK